MTRKVARQTRFSVAVISLFLLVALVSGFLGSAYADSVSSTPQARMIVMFDRGDSQQDKDDAIARLGGTLVSDLPLINGAVVLVPQGALAAAADARISWMGPDETASIQATAPTVIASSQTIPWGVSRIGANAVWDKNGDGQVDPGADAGAGVKVGIIDTGIDLNHPDLIANIKGGVNFVTPGASPQDDEGHGTHVAGTIAAVDNTIGVIGVAPQASLYAIKVLDQNGSGTYSAIISGLQWAVANGMQVVNMSLGGSTDDPALHAAITAAHNAGIVLVAAAGNSYGGAVSYPGAYPECIAVSATDNTNTLASFSSVGPQVQMAAPGVAIPSTYWSPATGTSGYATMSGTSMATPHVVGTAALIIASGIKDTNGDGVINDEVEARLDSTATDLGPAGRDTMYGFGLANALAAVGSGTTPPAVTTSAATSITRDSATLNGNLTSLGTAASANVSFQWGTTPATANATTPATVSATGAFSVSLTGLTAGTTYYFRAVATGDGTTYGSSLSFITPATAPTVTTAAATSVAATSATLNASLTGLGTAASVNVSFLWGTTVATTNETAPAAQSATGPFSANITGLTPGTLYYYRAKAAGDGTALGALMSFTYAVRAPAVQTLAATSVTRTSATLNGNLLSLGSASSVTVSFLYGTTAAVADGETLPAPQSATGAFSAGLTGLTQGTRYYYKAKVVGDTTSYGGLTSFMFVIRAPYVATSAASSITRTSALLNANLVSLGSAASVSVSFLYGTTPAVADGETAPVVMASRGIVTTGLTGLTPGATYYVRAKAVGDTTTYGAVVAFKTLFVAARLTTTAAVTQATGATLKGNLITLGSAASVNVSFLYGTTPLVADGETVPVTMSAPGAFSADLTGLTPGVRYYYRAKAVGDGTSYGVIYSILLSPPRVVSYSSLGAAASITSASARLNGSVLSLGSASAITVSFLWGTTQATADGETASVTMTQPGPFVIALPSLSPGTTYYYRAKAVGSGTALGEVRSFTTAP